MSRVAPTRRARPLEQTMQRWAHIVDLHRRGYSECEIARTVGLAKASVQQVLDKPAKMFRDIVVEGRPA